MIMMTGPLPSSPATSANGRVIGGTVQLWRRNSEMDML